MSSTTPTTATADLGEGRATIGEARRILEAAQLRLLKRHPYYLPILVRLRTVFTRELPTMAVDQGLRLYVNPDFIVTGGDDGLDEKEVAKIIETGLAHETMHVLRKDAQRSKNVNPQLWNLAADMEINQDIVNETINPFVMPDWAMLPKGSAEMFGLDEDLPEGLLAEAYYKLIPKPELIPSQSGQRSESGDESDESDGSDDENGKSRNSQEGSDGNAEGGGSESGDGDEAKDSNDGAAGGSGSDADSEPDDDADSNGGDSDECSDDGSDGDTDGDPDSGSDDDTQGEKSAGGGNSSDAGEDSDPANSNGRGIMSGSCGQIAGSDGHISPELEAAAEEQGAPPVSEIELKGALEEVVREIEETLKRRGDVPGHLQRLAEEHRKPPTVNWKQVFAKMLHRSLQEAGRGFRHTYRRKRRSGVPERPGSPVLPGRIGVRQKVAIVVDTSGSMAGPDLTAALDEVQGIIKATGSEIALYSCDAAVHGERQDIRSVKKAVLAGGGGTDMRVGIEAALDEKQVPDVVVILTDGYTPWPDERPVGKSRYVAGIVGAAPTDHDVDRFTPDWMKAVPVPVKQ